MPQCAILLWKRMKKHLLDLRGYPAGWIQERKTHWLPHIGPKVIINIPEFHICSKVGKPGESSASTPLLSPLCVCGTEAHFWDGGGIIHRRGGRGESSLHLTCRNSFFPSESPRRRLSIHLSCIVPVNAAAEGQRARDSFPPSLRTVESDFLPSPDWLRFETYGTCFPPSDAQKSLVYRKLGHCEPADHVSECKPRGLYRKQRSVLHDKYVVTCICFPLWQEVKKNN